ncbi:hypothetical protein BV20DRAFT_983738 [Pilatotrama ljubarskyi]|nr:hypothetical protein BV20DRAFT_983738 [Pilatotrama ljubarskyi]
MSRSRRRLRCTPANRLQRYTFRSFQVPCTGKDGNVAGLLQNVELQLRDLRTSIRHSQRDWSPLVMGCCENVRGVLVRLIDQIVDQCFGDALERMAVASVATSLLHERYRTICEQLAFVLQYEADPPATRSTELLSLLRVKHLGVLEEALARVGEQDPTLVAGECQLARLSLSSVPAASPCGGEEHNPSQRSHLLAIHREDNTLPASSATVTATVDSEGTGNEASAPSSPKAESGPNVAAMADAPAESPPSDSPSRIESEQPAKKREGKFDNDDEVEQEELGSPTRRVYTHQQAGRRICVLPRRGGKSAPPLSVEEESAREVGEILAKDPTYAMPLTGSLGLMGMCLAWYVHYDMSAWRDGS